jgi:predicted molibdopterin-dependent oxidoreductase YjgC
VCILCECNCGVEVQLGGKAGRHLVKVRGDDAHPASKGYAREKAHRLDFYQNGPDRLTKPLRRRKFDADIELTEKSKRGIQASGRTEYRTALITGARQSELDSFYVIVSSRAFPFKRCVGCLGT